MHRERKEAEENYNVALAAVRAAEQGTSLDAWERAEAELTKARARLIEAERRHPTKGERVRANRYYWLRNRGFDI